MTVGTNVHSNEDKSHCRDLCSVMIHLPFIRIILIDCRKQGREQGFTSEAAVVAQVRGSNGLDQSGAVVMVRSAWIVDLPTS